MPSARRAPELRLGARVPWSRPFGAAGTPLGRVAGSVSGIITPMKGTLASRPAPRPARGAAACLEEAERLFADFRALTPRRFRPFARSFRSFADYERWRRAQTNPWYR
jgi:hypothetical protein